MNPFEFAVTLITSAIDGRNNFKDVHIERSPARRFETTETSDEMLAAGADAYATPYGRVGQDLHYVVKLPENSAWDDLMVAQHMLDHPNPRLHLMFNQGDIGERIVTTGEQDE